MVKAMREGADRIWAQIWRKEANTNKLEKFDLSLNAIMEGGFKKIGHSLDRFLEGGLR